MDGRSLRANLTGSAPRVDVEPERKVPVQQRVTRTSAIEIHCLAPGDIKGGGFRGARLVITQPSAVGDDWLVFPTQKEQNLSLLL